MSTQSTVALTGFEVRLVWTRIGLVLRGTDPVERYLSAVKIVRISN